MPTVYLHWICNICARFSFGIPRCPFSLRFEVQIYFFHGAWTQIQWTHLPSGFSSKTSSLSSRGTARAFPSWPRGRHPSRPGNATRTLQMIIIYLFFKSLIITITLFILTIFITVRHPSHQGSAPGTITYISCLSLFVINHIANFKGVRPVPCEQQTSVILFQVPAPTMLDLGANCVLLG